jgi:arylsulfatase A-like enzyme
MPKRLLFAVALLFGPMLAAGSAAARCTSPTDVLRFESAVRGSLRCAEHQLFRSSPPPCTAPAPPACAAAEHAAILDLVYGEAPPGVASASTPAGRCQMGIGQAAISYLRRRIPDRLVGRRRAPLPRLLRKIDDRCKTAAVFSLPGGRLPAVAEQCASLAQSGDVDERLLARCLSARLEALVDAAVPQSLRPNVVVILTDDQRADMVDFMPTTLAEIADRGVRFSHALATTTACAPSRASILTGLYAHNHGIEHNASLLDGPHPFDHENNVAGWLRDAGYRTALFGKYLNNVYVLGDYKPDAWDEWQVFTRDNDNYRGYELNRNGQIVQVGQAESEYSTDRMADETMRFMRDHAAEPFFVLYAPYAPHEPFAPAARHLGTFANLPPARPPNFRPADVSLKPGWVKFSKSIANPDPSPIDQVRRASLETLLSVDEAVGDISKTLDQLGLTDNTLVIFLSDHGTHFGEHWWNGKFTSHEEALHVPLVMRYPRLYPVARASDDMVLNVDVAPTIAAAAGLSPPPMNGASLFAFLDGSLPPREDALHESVTNYIVPPNQALRTPEWKYIHLDAPSGIDEELYDLVADPYELVNLASDPAFLSLKQDLAAQLAVRRAE